VWSIAVINGIAYGSLLFLLAAGFSMIFGVLKVINLAHGSFYLLGGYVALSVVAAGGGFLPALAAGALVGALLGVVCERLLLYPLQGQYLPQVLVTMGVVLILREIVQRIWGGTPQLMPLPDALDWSVPLGGFSYPFYRLLLIGLGAALAAALWWLQERTRAGAMVRAAVDDEETAQTVGISVPRLRLAVFGAGGLLAGLTGGLGMPFLGARPGLDLEVFLLALVVVVVGGIGSLAGAYVVALLVGIVDSVGKIALPEASLFMLFLPMVLILVIWPAGISGRTLVLIAPPAGRRAIGPRWMAVRATLGGLIRGAARIPAPAALAVLGVLLAALPLIAPAYVANVVTLALIWSVFAMGLNVLLGFAGMPSLGHAAFFGMGAYAVAVAGQSQIGAQTGAWGLLALSLAGSLVLSMVLGAVALRTRLVYFLLATVALSQLLWGVAFKWRSVTGGDDGMRLVQRLGLSGGALEPGRDLYYAVALLFALVCFVLWRIYRSPFRLVLNGLRDNEARLAALGYDVWLYRFGAFILSGVLSGLAGAMYAFYARFVSPELLGVVTSAQVLLMVILGGAGTFWGPVVGAFGLVLMEEVLSGWTASWQAILGGIFILVVLTTRAGVVGTLRGLASPRGSG
jgi:branched-chain amino acid transport system permease protein